MSLTMYDSVTVGALPSVASSSNEAVAGYVDGRFADFGTMAAAFPHAHHLSIAVRASDDADCLDIETGDAAPTDGPAWVKRQIARGVYRPVLYANLNTMPAVESALRAAMISRSDVRLWVAHYTFVLHMEPGYDATQWTDHGPHGENFDQSELLDNFWDPPHHSLPVGTANFAGSFNTQTGHWDVKGTQGNFTKGGKDQWASAEIQFNPSTGHWRLVPLPWNAPPLGR